MKLKIATIIITSLLLISISSRCKKEFELPSYYNGYALLQTEGTGIDGVILFTIYPLPNLNNELIKSKINYSKFLKDKSLTLITTPIEPYLEVRQELFDKKWIEINDVILIKIDYEISETYWKQYTNTKINKIKIENEVYKIENVVFNSQVNSIGKYLYKVNNLKIIRKLN